MNWVILLWSAAAGASALLALMHGLAWLRNRDSWHYLCFSVMALSVIAMAVGEVTIMQELSPERVGWLGRWIHVIYAVTTVSSMGFVHLHFGTGSRPLLLIAVGLRAAALVANFTTGENLHLIAVERLDRLPFLGTTVSILGQWTANPWALLGQAASLAQLIYVLEASQRLWRRGGPDDRRRALVVGGALSLFIVSVSAQAGLVVSGVLRMPFVMSLLFLAVLVAMSHELSREIWRASRLSRDLGASERRLTLAASAARVVLWEWQAGRPTIWTSSGAGAFFDIPPDQPLNYEHFTRSLHPDDRDAVLAKIQAAVEQLGAFTTDYRRVYADGSVRWFADSGTAEREATTGAVLLRGVSMDVTETQETKEALRAQRDQLSHTLRLATMTQMASSLAHELNQPLTAIVNNANAARRMMAKDTATREELLEIFEDIAADGRRAGSVIQGIRSLTRPQEQKRVGLRLNGVISDLMPLITAEAHARRVEVVEDLADALPKVSGDPVQIQQVLLNLAINAMDALDMPGATERKVVIRTEAEGVSSILASVRDYGPGLPPEGGERLFDAFFTTKPHGLGMGLAIVRSLVEAHGGTITASNAPGGGALFQFRLPTLADALS